MSWQLTLLIILGSLVVLMASGLPVAYSFLTVNVVAIYVLWGGLEGLRQLVLSMYSSVATFALVPVPLFILMGEVMFHSGVAFRMMNTLNKWIGRVPGRLSLLAVGGGTLFATLSGSSMASTAMLGSILIPEMEQLNYKRPMTIGPILGSGTLAAMIPPTALGVLLASLSQVSVGGLLLAIIVPGLMMSTSFGIYIIVRCYFQPDLAPRSASSASSWRERILDGIRYILPLGLIIFLVIGLIILGVATPNEAAALGALGTFVLAFAYNKGVKWTLIRKAFSGTLNVTGMMLLILAGSTAFSQVLAFSGATQSLVNAALQLTIPPLGMLVLMQLILVVMGMFMEPLSILMVTLPLFLPIAKGLDFDLIWFCVLILLNMEMAAISPPFGMSLFVMKGVVPDDVRMSEIYRASYPFLLLDGLVMSLIIAFPAFALWLPGVAQ